MSRDITSANASIIVTVEDLFPAGFKLEQFSTDSAVSEGDETFAETRMGVDLQMVAGYVDQIKTLTVVLEPSSPSIPFMNQWIKAQRTNQKIYWAKIMISIPSVSQVLKYSDCVLKTGKLLPDVKQVLDPITYTFDCGKVE